MIIRPHTGVGLLRSKEKYIPVESGDIYPNTDREYAYWVLSRKIEEAFGFEGATISEIYSEITLPLRLSIDDTSRLVKGAVSSGYLKVV